MDNRVGNCLGYNELDVLKYVWRKVIALGCYAGNRDSCESYVFGLSLEDDFDVIETAHLHSLLAD